MISWRARSGVVSEFRGEMLKSSFVFYQDDIFLWEEDAAALSKRIALIADGLGKIGLTLAEDKTMIIASKHYKGPRKALICGKRVDIQDDSMKIRVLGVNFAFGDSPGQQAKDLLSRATSAASFHEDILNEDGKWEDKARMLDALVESTFTWAAAAVQWNKEELSMANSIQIRALRRAFGLRRKSGEEWLDWNTRTWRLVRAWMHTNKVRRWSSHILQLQHGLLGHRARQSEGRNNDGATQHGIAYRMLSWRNHAWWKTSTKASLVDEDIQDAFIRTVQNVELLRQLDSTEKITQNREVWRCWQEERVKTFDVKWSFGGDNVRFAGKPVYLLVNAPVRLSEAAADEPCVGRLSAAVQCLPSTLPSSTPSLPCGAMWRWLLLLGVLARGGPSGDESETSWKSDPEPWDELENQDDPADARGERMDSQDDSVREDASENMDEDVGGSQGRLLWSPDPKDWKLGGLRLLLQVHGVPEEAEAEEWADPARGDPSPEEPDHDSELPEGREAPSLEAQVHEPELPGEDLRGGAQEPGEPGLPREEEGAPVPLYDRDGQQSLYPPREVRMGRGGDHNLGDDPSMGRDDLEPRTLRELLGDGRELRRGQPRLPLASVLGDGRDLRRGQRAERGRRAEYETGQHPRGEQRCWYATTWR